MTYCAIIGRHPSISLAELRCVFSDFSQTRSIGNDVILFETSAEITQETLSLLGGTILIAKEIASSWNEKDIPGVLVRETRAVKGKITFSLRGVRVPFGVLRTLYRSCKDALKNVGRPARYIGTEREPAASVLLHKNDLLSGKGGCELVLLQDGSFTWLGRTVAAQDVHSYTKRDMEKPVRDTRAGLLPPKLAQILLNFGLFLVKKDSPLTLYDPFCGTGVIPMEALLRGWHVLGSDSSQKAVTGCEKNLEWVRKTYDVKKRDAPSRIWKQDARKAFVFEKNEKPDLVVTETMLGPALTGQPSAKDAAKYRTECAELELEFLKNAAACLPGVPVVATFPVWFTRTETVMLDKPWEQFGKLGYRAVLPPGIQPDLPSHTSLLYRRPDQFVGREILLLQPLHPHA